MQSAAMELSAKEYLRQIKDMDNLICTYQDEIDTLMSKATSTTQHIKEVNVMSSQGEQMDDTVAKIVDIRNDINALIDKYIDMKNSARRVIEQMQVLNYQTVLLKYYFQNKTFEQTAVEMSMSYQWICELHGRALMEFDKIKKDSSS